MTARRLSQFITLALAALTVWVMISASEIRPSDPFAVEIYVAFLIVVAFLFVASFYALRFGAGGSAIYWSMDGKDQIRPIGWMVLAALAAMFVIGGLLDGPGGMDSVYAAVAGYLLAWTFVPAAFLHFGLVVWPVRSGMPRRLKLILIATAAIGLAGAWSYVAYIAAPDRMDLFPVGPTLIRLGTVILGATVEEIVSRVLLLTAMLSLTGSRFQALFLSSVAFAMMHVPGQFAQPLVTADWALLRHVVHDYSPIFLGQTVIGLVLGVLWLRTGSISLIALTHALFNAGKILALGL